MARILKSLKSSVFLCLACGLGALVALICFKYAEHYGTFKLLKLSKSDKNDLDDFAASKEMDFQTASNNGGEINTQRENEGKMGDSRKATGDGDSVQNTKEHEDPQLENIFAHEQDYVKASKQDANRGEDKRVDTSNNLGSQLGIDDTVMSLGVKVKPNTGEEKCTKKLPQCIVIGAQKGGTSALVNFLKFHPKIKVGSNVGDELQFFTVHYRKGLEWYRSKMPCSKPGDVTMEKSPPYFIYPKTAAKVYKYNSTVQLILTVIDPIQRALSNYVMDKAHNKMKNINSFEEAVTSKKTGLLNPKHTFFKRSYYDNQLDPWLKYFSMKQIHIVNGKELIDNPLVELKKIEKFIGVQPFFTKDTIVYNSEKEFYCPRNVKTGELVCLGDNKGRPHPEISQPTLGYLQELFKPHNNRFFDMIGQRLDWGY